MQHPWAWRDAWTDLAQVQADAMLCVQMGDDLLAAQALGCSARTVPWSRQAAR